MATLRRIAMWSGPRNISTAMMRAWGNRPDTFVCDEPLYAHYLCMTGASHPGADEVIHAQENDWRKVVAWLTTYVPEGKTVFFQKHMTHHLLPEIDRGWLDLVTHAFLIREPRAMVGSLARVVAEPRIDDTGLPQQLELFEYVRERTGRLPPVIDARDVLQDPPRILCLLCNALDVPFMDAMLSWPPGLRDTDGVWAKYWYDAVSKTTSFQPYQHREVMVPTALAGLVDRAEAIYLQLHEHRLRP